MKNVLTPFRVGLLVIISGVILFVFLTFVKKGGMREDESILVYAYFKDASGLGKKSRVQIAGIPVGEIAAIELVNMRARVSLRIKKDVGVREDASLGKRSESVLGDFMLDLTPGSESSPLMKDGGEIKNIKSPTELSDVIETVATISADVQQVTASLRNVLGGDKGQGNIDAIVQNLVKLTEAVNATVRASAAQLDTILRNVDAISGDVKRLTASEENTVRNIVTNVDTIAKDVRDVIATVKRVVGENEGEVKGDVASVKETIAHLDKSLANIEEVTQKVKEGKGAVGTLVADNRLGLQIRDTVESLNEFASKLTNLELEVGIKSDYLMAQGSAKNVLGLRLIPKPDKYYLLEAVDDPRGSTQTVYVQQNPPSAGQPVIQKQTITSETIKFTAQFAKRYSFLTLRFGIIESTGGVGADVNIPIRYFYYSRWLEDALVLKVDAFNFSVETLKFPRLRATIRWTPFEHVYVNAGFDDVLNNPNRDSLTNRLISGRDFFLGAGIYFTDADLKSLLPVIPKI